MLKKKSEKQTRNFMSGKMRAIVCVAFIFGLLLSFTFRLTDVAKVSAQTSENEIVASPESADVPFTNASPITINDSPTPPTLASRYPSQIMVPVEGPNLTTVTKVQVKLFGFTHTFPDDLDIILVGPQGQRAMLMSDAGGSDNVSNINLTFSPAATTILPDSTVLTTGTYRPANYDTTDTFPAPGPGVLTNAPTDLSVFNLTNPNGVWSLYIVDDAQQDAGEIAFGWTLVLTVPQIFTVNSTSDESDPQGCNLANCSLPEAITAAQNGDLINFSSAFNTPQTIDLTFSTLNINRSVTIQGPGANLLTVRRDYNATAGFRIFTIPAGVANGVAISGMTIADGRRFNDNSGGGIHSLSTLTLTNVHVTGNHANASGGGVALFNASGVFTNCAFTNNLAVVSSGGAILFDGGGVHTLRIAGSTVSGNNSDSFGGGIYHINNAAGNSRLEITNSTIVNNTAANTGGGIAMVTSGNTANLATTTLRNTIIAGNTIGATNSPNNLATATFDGGARTFETLGFNLSDNFTGGGFTPIPGSDITNATPRLAPLALYGGQTPTHALLHSSPAIGAGNASGATTDQRGAPRPPTGADIGAVEIQPLVVTNDTNSGGAGSLRSILAGIANETDINDIQFENAFFSTPRTITLTSGELAINGNANIIAPGADLLTISGNNQSRVFRINSGFTASLSGMTITGGNTGGSGGGILNNGSLTVTHSAVSGNTANGFSGGGIHNINAGTLTVTNSTISGNTANGTGSTSGGIDSSGNLTVINSTISDNRAPNGGGNGGGIWTNGLVVITNSTIANNSAAGANSASGVLRISATVTIRNSIIAGNVNNATQPDVVASGGTGITSNGFNLIGNRGAVTFNQTGDQSGTGASPLDPGLAALSSQNGGTTQTHALLSGSAALDAGNSSGLNADQRGLRRPFDLTGINNISDGADIGAFEAQTAPPLPTISIGDVSQIEGNSGFTFFNYTVTLSAASGQTVSVSYATANGTATAGSDYTAIGATTLNFAPGETVKQFGVAVNGDTTFEPNETFFVNLSSPTNATIADNQGIGTIVNDDAQPTISITDVSQIEGNTGVSDFIFTVNLSAPSGGAVTVAYQTADGTATAPFDYIAVPQTTLTFAPGETVKQAIVPVRGDSAFEPDETFFVNLSNPTGATIADNQGIGTILNDGDAQPTISINDVSNNEGNSGTSNFTFNASLSNASSQTITVSFATADGTANAPSDYTAIGATVLTFNPNETSKQVSVSVNGDTTVEPNETFFVNLSAPTNATIADNQGIGTILNDDVSQTFTVINTDDAGAGSLRQAVTDANNNSAPDTINFSALFNTAQTINLATALPDITGSVTINGTGANLLTVRRAFDAATDFRIFNIQNLGLNITISGMTISNGRLSAPSGSFGGGIRSQSHLTLTNVHVTGNHATNGGGGASVAAVGGVFTGCTFSGNTTITGAGAITYQGGGGTLRLVNSTVSGNSTAGNGGGIFVLSNVANNRLELVNSTIANNSGGSGGGIRTSGSFATTTLRNTIVAGNTPNNLTTEGGATVMTNGFNLSDNFNGVFTLASTDRTGQPRLAPLSLIGGQTPAHALLGDSPALDAGDSSGSTTDQRGQPRAFDTPGVPNSPDFADIGAVEMRSVFVTNADNDGAGSLRQVITAAPANSDILFDPAFFNVARAITLTTGEMVINQNLNIHGTGANLLTVSGNNQSRVFSITSGFTASLNGMTMTGGNGVGAFASGFGGGIVNQGNLTISDSAISVNNATNGGGITSTVGTFNLIRSTISNNTAANQGGGLNLQNGNGTLTNSTISGNTANSSSNAGGGIVLFSSGGSFTLQATNCTIANNNTGTPNTGSGIVTNGVSPTASATTLLRNTIIANNSLPNLRATNTGGGAAAAIMSQGFNLASDNDGNFLTAPGDQININPMLATLRNNNGTTQTHALLGGSPALDAGNSSGSTTDQRGNRRPVDLSGIINAAGGDGTDIGAFEAQLMPTADDILIEGFVRTARGAPIVGAIITLSGSAQETMPTDGDGHYRFTVPSGGIYQVNVSARGFRFSPAQQTFGSLVVNQVADFMALPAKGRTSPRPRVR